jgi:hypothetical protein
VYGTFDPESYLLYIRYNPLMKMYHFFFWHLYAYDLFGVGDYLDIKEPYGSFGELVQVGKNLILVFSVQLLIFHIL